MLSTNAGQSMTKQKANVPKWGEVWFNKNGTANIFSLASMIKCHRVMFDSDKEAAFLVHTPEGVIKFSMSPEGLFYHALNYRTATQLTQTVVENQSCHSHQQREWAKRTCDLLHTLACPTAEDLKKIIKMNSVQDCPVTIKDIKLSEAILELSPCTWWARTTRRRQELLTAYMCILQFIWHKVGMNVTTLQLARSLIITVW